MPLTNKNKIADVADSCALPCFCCRPRSKLFILRIECSRARIVVQCREAAPNSAICLICLMAHSAAAAVLMAVFSLTFRKRARISVPQVRPSLFLESFQLYVRPPPAI